MIRTLEVSLEDLGHIKHSQEKTDCITMYEESISFYQSIGDQSAESVLALILGDVYRELSAIHNLDIATHWYQRSLEFRSENDNMGRGKCLGQLGLVAYEQFQEACTACLSEEILLQHINESFNYYQKACWSNPFQYCPCPTICQPPL